MIVDIDKLRALAANRERLRQLEQDESLTQRVMTYCDVPPDVIDALVEEAREAI